MFAYREIHIGARALLDINLVWPMFRISIRGIRNFLGLSDPDPLARGMDPDSSIIKQNSKKNLDFFCFVTSL
jgi:hypothetical protein